MRHDQDRAAPLEVGNGLADGLFAPGVEGARRFVHKEDARFGQEGTGDRQTLALPAGEPLALFADNRVESIGQRVHELRGVRGTQCGTHPCIVGVRVAVADVVPHRAGEEHRVLRHEGDLAAQRIEGETPGIHPGHRHGTLRGVVEALDQIEERTLAGAGRADQGDGLPWVQVEFDVGEYGHVRTGRIAEGHAAEGDRAGSLERQRAGGFGEGGRGVQQFHEPFGGTRGPLEFRPHLADGADGPATMKA